MEEKHFLIRQMTVYRCTADVRTFVENLNARKLSEVGKTFDIIFRELFTFYIDSKYSNTLAIEIFLSICYA